MLVHPQFDPVAVSFGPWEVAGHVLGPNLADMLSADDPLAVDQEALRHARRAERHLQHRLIVKADAIVRITVALEELADVARPIAHGDAFYRHARLLHINVERGFQFAIRNVEIGGKCTGCDCRGAGASREHGFQTL